MKTPDDYNTYTDDTYTLTKNFNIDSIGGSYNTYTLSTLLENLKNKLYNSITVTLITNPYDFSIMSDGTSAQFKFGRYYWGPYTYAKLKINNNT